MAKKLLPREERRASLIKTGVKLASKRDCNWKKLSCAKVAKANGVTAPLVFHIFGSRENLHAAIREAMQ